MKLTFYISRTKQIYAKTLTVSESKFKAMSPSVLFEILLTSAVICKERILHKNEIVQYLQNYKHQDVNQDDFRKPFQASINAMQNDYRKTAHTFFVGRSILTTFLRLNCYNFRNALTKLIKVHFLEIAFQPLKTGQNSHSCSNPVRNSL